MTGCGTDESARHDAVYVREFGSSGRPYGRIAELLIEAGQWLQGPGIRFEDIAASYDSEYGEWSLKVYYGRYDPVTMKNIYPGTQDGHEEESKENHKARQDKG